MIPHVGTGGSEGDLNSGTIGGVVVDVSDGVVRAHGVNLCHAG
jgi:hypothetical protein